MYLLFQSCPVIFMRKSTLLLHIHLQSRSYLKIVFHGREVSRSYVAHVRWVVGQKLLWLSFQAKGVEFCPMTTDSDGCQLVSRSQTNGLNFIVEGKLVTQYKDCKVRHLSGSENFKFWVHLDICHRGRFLEVVSIFFSKTILDRKVYPNILCFKVL